MKKRKYIPFNLLKIELKISSQKNTKILKEMKGKNKIVKWSRRKNELKGWSLGFIVQFYRRIHRWTYKININSNYSIGDALKSRR
jgi:hypothetical protein